MGCTTSAGQDMQTLFPTREQFDTLLPHIGGVRLKARSEYYLLSCISGTSSYAITAVTTDEERTVRGAFIFEQDVYLILKIHGKVRVLPGQSSCWYIS
jgi:hypothetical protein